MLTKLWEKLGVKVRELLLVVKNPGSPNTAGGKPVPVSQPPVLTRMICRDVQEASGNLTLPSAHKSIFTSH